MKPMILLSLFLIASVVYVADKISSSDDAAAPLPPLTPASRFENVRGSMDYYRERLMREPDEVGNYVALAQLHLQEMRETGREADHLPRAERLLDEALDREPENAHALALQGTLLNSLHRFEDARDVAERLLAEDEHDAYAHGVLVDALVELGHYDAAVRACDRMLELRPGLPSYARAAYLRQLHGDDGGALMAMRLAAEAGPAGSEGRAWALYNLGVLHLEAVRLDTAAFIFEGILDERPGYALALAGLGRIDGLRGRRDEALERFEQAYAEEPRPEFLGYLMDAHLERGDRASADSVRRRLRESFREAQRMGENVDMEYADFLADQYADQDEDLEGALRLAEREYARRPDHVHVQETYAWALHQNGRSDEAVPVIERALGFGSPDAMMHYRAAQIYGATGQRGRELSHLRRALDGHLHVESLSAARWVRERLEDVAS